MKKLLYHLGPWEHGSYKLLRNYILASWFERRGCTLLASALTQIGIRRFNCHISPKAKISSKVFFPHPIGIVIGRGVEIEDGAQIYQNVTIGAGKVGGVFGYPRIGRNAVIYPNAVVIGPITVGTNARVGAHCLLRRSVPDGMCCFAPEATL